MFPIDPSTDFGPKLKATSYKTNMDLRAFLKSAKDQFQDRYRLCFSARNAIGLRSDPELMVPV